MSSPRVSVLILTYNQQAFVEHTLLSALEQDYEDLEVVVSDDHSSDSTTDIIRGLMQKYPRRLVAMLNDTRLGVSGNTNRALRACKGEYIAFQGGDDLLLPGKIRRQVAFMDAHPDIVLSHHDVDVFDSTTGKTLYFWSQRYGKHSGGARSVVRLGTYMCGTSVMARRERLPAHGVDERVRIASDWLLWVETLAESGGQFGYMDEILARYRRSASNVTGDWNWKFEDQNQTLAIIEARWPEYTTLVRKRRSELYFVQAAHHLKLKHWKAAWHLGWGAILSAFPSAPWLRLVIRELFFLLHRRGQTDDLVDNLGTRK